ncbi:kelch-like protein 1 [Saccostrea cucullata]|uniref:kelch-like protein 1 n=1 Tax=Saccostrea cuccullata TaxID=36930 RepID=UPI002ED3E4B5
MASQEPRSLFDRGSLSFLCFEDAFPQLAWERERERKRLQNAKMCAEPGSAKLCAEPGSAKLCAEPGKLPITNKIKRVTQWLAHQNSMNVDGNRSENNSPTPTSERDTPPWSRRNHSGSDTSSTNSVNSRSMGRRNIQNDRPTPSLSRGSTSSSHSIKSQDVTNLQNNRPANSQSRGSTSSSHSIKSQDMTNLQNNRQEPPLRRGSTSSSHSIKSEDMTNPQNNGPAPPLSCGSTASSHSIKSLEMTNLQNKRPSPPMSRGSTSSSHSIKSQDMTNPQNNRPATMDPPLTCGSRSSLSSSSSSRNLSSKSPPSPQLRHGAQSGSAEFSEGHDLHYSNLGRYIREKFHCQEICDMAFRVGDKIIPAHKIVLASRSPLFANIFEKESFRKEAVIPKIINIRGVSEDSLMVFLEFLYSGTITIEADTFSDLLKLARVFKVNEIKRLCLNYINDANYEELLKRLPMVKDIEEMDCFAKMLNAIGKNFLQVKESRSFFEVDKEILAMILAQDCLNTKSEMDVFTSISWIHHHDYEIRIQYLEELLSFVRFPLMSQAELFRCFKIFPPLRNNMKVVEMITMANWIQTSYSLHEDDPLENMLPRKRNELTSSQSVNSYTKTNSSTAVKNEVEVEMYQMDHSMAQDFNAHARSSTSHYLCARVEKYESPKSKTFTRRKIKDIKNENNRYVMYTCLFI